METSIQEPKGKLGVLIIGLNGAVSTTFLAGTLAVRKGLAVPVGSLTQLSTIRIGNRAENNFPLIKEFIPIADLNDLVFGGWDIRDENCYDSAAYAKVLKESDLLSVKDELQAIRPMPGVFEQRFVVRLKGTFIKKGVNKFDLMEQVRDWISGSFQQDNNLERLVIIWCGSTEIFMSMNDIFKNT